MRTSSPPAPPSAADAPHFVKALTLTDATMLVTGSMIGSGIFIVSADIGRITGAVGWLLAAWVLTGVMTLLGALSYGELAAMHPRAGGQYVFLREAFGPLAGFLYGWTLFTVIQAGTIAAVAVAFGRFLGVLFPGAVSEQVITSLPHWTLFADDPTRRIEMGVSTARLVGLVSVWVLTWVNWRGVREGKLVQTTLTTVKIGALALLVLAALTVGRDPAIAAANFDASRLFALPADASTFALVFAAAMVGALFSSDAWNGVTFAAAEVQRPERNLPRALLFGTGLVTLLYLAANVAYLCVLPFEGDPAGATPLARGLTHARFDRVGVAVAEQMSGATGAVLMACAILISTFGCNNGLILSGARVSYAMARDGLFFARLGTLNARNVPGAALVAQAVWTSVLCLTGTYSQLLDYVIFAALVFYALTTIGLFVLRRKRPDQPRPYRAIGYPVLPALYVVLTASLAVLLLFADKTRAQALSGLGLVLLGIPVYLLWRRAPAAR